MILELDLCSIQLFTIYSSFLNLKVHVGIFNLFDSPCVSMRLHVKEDVKGMIFILNQNYINLSFYEN